MYTLALNKTILGYIKKCLSQKALESVYASMIKTNTIQDCFLMNQFISSCSALSYVDFASSAFAHMENPNAFVYNALIRGCGRCCYPDHALGFYIRMLRNNVMPNSYSFSSLVKACTLLMDSVFGKAVHGHIWKYGFDSHMFVQTTLVEFYSTLGDVSSSRRVFDDMLERDVFAWTTMILAHCLILLLVVLVFVGDRKATMSSLGTSKGILEIAKFGVYVTVPIILMYTFANNSSNLRKFMGNRSYIEYPPEAERPPSPDELRQMAREIARRRNNT
ncbi:Pentatricopeptide repeat-containing protein [Vigna angularis]|uniref:Pentatricopeptide repeat-containing protein n=1 Tax=Phaseolus angularis TaxID=3914 RepID=A0A8T0JSN9_PHAAN|nr:Pentatricopeptide repeat-containing protein [Vigna angularis]